MTPAEKIRAIAAFLLRLKQEKTIVPYAAFEDIRSITSIQSDEARSICELLRKKGLLAFEYMPFGDTPAVFISLDKNQSDYTSLKGAMRFFALSTDEDTSLPREIEDVNFDALEEVIESQALLDDLVRGLRPEVLYDSATSELVSDGKRLSVGPHNSQAIAQLVFSKPLGTRIPEADVAALLDDTKVLGEFKKADRAGYTYLYNSVNRLNDKIEELTGIHRLIQYKKGKIWIE